MKNRIPGLIWIPAMMLLATLAMLYVADGSSDEFTMYFMGIFLAILFVLLLLIDYLNQIIDIYSYKKLTDSEKARYEEEAKLPWYTALYNSAFKKQSEEEEQAIIIDHGFDGITELDNGLPKWWLGLFYLGIVYAVFWWTNYFVLDYDTPDQEYVKAVKIEQVRFAKWEKTAPVVNMDNVKLLTDETSLAQGEELFNSVCATCHEAGGTGSTGPNLTDGYWKNHRQDDLYKNIFDMVSNGKLEAGMPPHLKENGGPFLGYKIEKIASYVYSLSAKTRQESKNLKGVSGGKVKEGETWKGSYPDAK